MADAVTAAIGAIIMIGYILLIAAKLAAGPLWVCVLIGLALMLWGFWWEDWEPVVKPAKK
jgi:Zn-dependent protease with chaperone function